MQPEPGAEVVLVSLIFFPLIPERDGVSKTLWSKRGFLVMEAVIQLQKTWALSQPEARDFTSSGFYEKRTEPTLSPKFLG